MRNSELFFSWNYCVGTGRSFLLIGDFGAERAVFAVGDGFLKFGMRNA